MTGSSGTDTPAETRRRDVTRASASGPAAGSATTPRGPTALGTTAKPSTSWASVGPIASTSGPCRCRSTREAGCPHDRRRQVRRPVAADRTVRRPDRLPTRQGGLMRMYPIWTPRDGAELRAVADEFPVEVGQSPVLALIVEREGIE